MAEYATSVMRAVSTAAARSGELSRHVQDEELGRRAVASARRGERRQIPAGGARYVEVQSEAAAQVANRGVKAVAARENVYLATDQPRDEAHHDAETRTFHPARKPAREPGKPDTRDRQFNERMLTDLAAAVGTPAERKAAEAGHALEVARLAGVQVPGLNPAPDGLSAAQEKARTSMVGDLAARTALERLGIQYAPAPPSEQARKDQAVYAGTPARWTRRGGRRRRCGRTWSRGTGSRSGSRRGSSTRPPRPSSRRCGPARRRRRSAGVRSRLRLPPRRPGRRPGAGLRRRQGGGAASVDGHSLRIGAGPARGASAPAPSVRDGRRAPGGSRSRRLDVEVGVSYHQSGGESLRARTASPAAGPDTVRAYRPYNAVVLHAQLVERGLPAGSGSSSPSISAGSSAGRCCRPPRGTRSASFSRAATGAGSRLGWPAPRPSLSRPGAYRVLHSETQTTLAPSRDTRVLCGRDREIAAREVVRQMLAGAGARLEPGDRVEYGRDAEGLVLCHPRQSAFTSPGAWASSVVSSVAAAVSDDAALHDAVRVGRSAATHCVSTTPARGARDRGRGRGGKRGC